METKLLITTPLSSNLWVRLFDLAHFTPHHKFFFTLRTDFSTMEHKLETSQYQSMDAFVADAKLVFRNCRNYNQEGSIYVRNANKLEKALIDMLEKIEVD